MTTRPVPTALYWSSVEAPYENIPLRPTLRPLLLYVNVFGSLMPGGTSGQNMATLVKSRAAK